MSASSVLSGSASSAAAAAAASAAASVSLASVLPASVSALALPVRTHLRFDLDAQKITELADVLITKVTRTYDEVAAVPTSERTIENTLLPLSRAEAAFSTMTNCVSFPSYVSTDKEVRDASTAATSRIEEAEVELGMRRDVFEALSALRATTPASDLDAETNRLLDKLLEEFVRNGVAFEGEKRERVMALKKRIAQLCIEFQQRLTEDTTAVAFSREDLAGLPDRFIDNLGRLEPNGERKSPQEASLIAQYLVSMKYPELVPAMQRCSNSETRRRLDLANGSRCMENAGVLEEVARLRHELAVEMGSSSFAEHQLKVRMAKTPTIVEDFLATMRDRLRVKAQAELAGLQALKKSDVGGSDTGIRGWDLNYYIRLSVEREYAVDDLVVQQYFPMESVTTYLLRLYQDILGLRFEPAWHEDVQLFLVSDKDSSELMGAFLLDLYPRDGKYGHAAVFPLQYSCAHHGDESRERQLPIAAMVANFTKPTSDTPSLLKHSEVVTYFHEFGHVMHNLCSSVQHARFAGTRVERDFVEAPSQMKENWCWEPSVLKAMSRHVETSERLPDELIEQMIRAKNAHSGLMYLRQVFFGTFDLLLHTQPQVDTAALWHQLRHEITLVDQQAGTNPAATFGHLAGGYEAGYYGYLWSQVYSADMYSKFVESGDVTSPSIGRRYRQAILARGGTVDGMDMVVDFLGRAPNEAAFLKSIGAV